MKKIMTGFLAAVALAVGVTAAAPANAAATAGKPTVSMYCVTVAKAGSTPSEQATIQEDICSTKSLADARAKSPRITSALHALDLPLDASTLDVSKSQAAVVKTSETSRSTASAAASASVYLATTVGYNRTINVAVVVKELWGSSGTCDRVGYRFSTQVNAGIIYRIERPSRWEGPVVNTCDYAIFDRNGQPVSFYLSFGDYVAPSGNRFATGSMSAATIRSSYFTLKR